jgi:hypothetical protein
MRCWFMRLRRILYWGLPPLLLYLIFSRLDLERLLDLGQDADIWLVMLGVGLIVPKIVVGAMRWHRLAKAFDCVRMALGQAFLKYWFSLSLGVFTPGSLGSDVYRVALGGQQTGRYLRNAFVIVLEKLFALLSCVALIAVVYPFIDPSEWSAEFESAIHLVYAAMIGSLGFLAVLAYSHRSDWLARVAGPLWQRISRLAKGAASALPGPEAVPDEMSSDPRSLLRALFSRQIWAPALILSLTIHLVGAIQGQIFLQALGYDLPFLVNVFIAPLNVLVLTLPITVGGIGVREGAFVLFYGAFGVPMEIALLVSFCSLISVLLGHAVGGLIFVAQRKSIAGRQEIKVDG